METSVIVLLLIVILVVLGVAGYFTYKHIIEPRYGDLLHHHPAVSPMHPTHPMDPTHLANEATLHAHEARRKADAASEMNAANHHSNLANQHKDQASKVLGHQPLAQAIRRRRRK
jgi:hypothetical protein